jgi:hypothetical protein
VFSFAKKKTKTVLIIDISSSSVGAGISIIPTDTLSTMLPQSIAFVRNTIPLKEHFDATHFLQTTLKYLDASLQSLGHKTKLVPDMVQCTISSPWFVSHARTIVYEELTPFICTEKLVQSLVAQELEKIRNTTSDEELVTIEQQISQFTLNGYITQSPFDKKTNSMTIGLCVTQSSKECIEHFNTLIRRFYGTKKIHYTTTPFAIASVVAQKSSSEGSAMIVHIGEHITDIGFTKDGTFLYQHSFPIGMYTLFQIMHDKGVPRGQANALIDGYAMNMIHDEKKRIVEHSLRLFSKEWIGGLTTILMHGFFGFSIPKKATILVDSRFVMFFQTAISSHPLLRYSSGAQKITCVCINPDLFAGDVAVLNPSETQDPVGLLVTAFSAMQQHTLL